MGVLNVQMCKKIKDIKYSFYNLLMENPPNIKHIVISGGCLFGLYEYGALKELHNNGFWNNNNIESIFGTSVGALIAVILALKIDFEIFDKYVIERPWDHVVKKHSYNLLETYNNRGLFHKQLFYDFCSPLFKSCDIDPTITMLEFYEKTGIEIHIYVTELNSFESIDVSYKTYPDWIVIEAVYASCTVPTIFSPIISGDKCYIDGGVFNNYPLKKCLEVVEDKDTILGISICNSNEEDDHNKTIITEESTFLDFTSIFLNRIIKNVLFLNKDVGIIKYEIFFSTPITTLDSIFRIVSSKEEREKMIQDGCQKAREFYIAVCTNLSK